MRDTITAVAGAAALGIGLPLTGGWLATVGATQLEAVSAPSPAQPDEVLILLVALTGAVVAAWLWLGLLVALLGHLPGALGAGFRHASERVAPVAVRRVAAVLVGASLSGALAPGTATAGGPDAVASAAAPSPSFAVTSASVDAPSPGFAPSPNFAAVASVPAEAADVAPASAAAPASPTLVGVPTSPAPGWTPTRPLVRPQPSPHLLTAAPADDERPGTVVRRGDTLWDVVRHHLGPDATDAEVAAEWPRWHAANRNVIGADPDLLLPGQVLHAPETAGALR